MRTNRVSAQVTISVYTDVQADTAEEAAEIAEERSLPHLCHRCSGGDADTEWSLSGELDGEPKIMPVEEWE